MPKEQHMSKYYRAELFCNFQDSNHDTWVFEADVLVNEQKGTKPSRVSTSVTHPCWTINLGHSLYQFLSDYMEVQFKSKKNHSVSSNSNHTAMGNKTSHLLYEGGWRWGGGGGGGLVTKLKQQHKIWTKNEAVHTAAVFLLKKKHSTSGILIIYIFNLQISTISQASSPLIFRPFTQPFLIRNLKADSQL